jgi:hypothetical protein
LGGVGGVFVFRDERDFQTFQCLLSRFWIMSGCHIGLKHEIIIRVIFFNEWDQTLLNKVFTVYFWVHSPSGQVKVRLGVTARADPTHQFRLIFGFSFEFFWWRRPFLSSHNNN